MAFTVERSFRLVVTLTLAAAWMLAMIFTPLALAQETDPERGRAKSLQCVSCHGVEGRTTNPMFPNLAGQNATYLAIQLNEFKSGERYHPVMSPIAEALTEQDINDLAAYFSRLDVLDESRTDNP